MPAIADLPAISCYLLFSETGIGEDQWVGPDLSLTSRARARGRRGRGAPRYAAHRETPPYWAAAARGCAAAEAGLCALRNARTCLSASWICSGFAFHG